jgi:chromosomal replication initiation ATPase DnaA
MTQATLDFNFEPEYHQDDFLITNANLEAYRAVGNPAIWPDSRLLIVGERGSGKTHLCSIFAAMNNAAFIPEGKNFHQHNYKAIVFENIDKCKNEEFLFHLINYCKGANILLLLTASKYPEYKLLDLRSRINSTLKILIKSPDIELLKVLLAKQMSDRQIKLPAESLNYIITHGERSFEFIKQFCAKLDKISLQHKSKPSLKLVKQVLED